MGILQCSKLIMCVNLGPDVQRKQGASEGRQFQVSKSRPSPDPLLQQLLNSRGHAGELPDGTHSCISADFLGAQEPLWRRRVTRRFGKGYQF